MKWRSAISVVVVSIVMVLRMAAYASPPDPSWIAGFWDDGDHDDAIILITHTAATTDVRPPFDAAPTRLVVARIEGSRPSAAPARPLSPQRPRAPPAQ